MKLRAIPIVAAAVAALSLVRPAYSAVIYDESPSGSYFDVWGNSSGGNNWLLQFTLGSETLLTGMDIWTDGHFDWVTDGVLKLRSDQAGAPAATNDLAHLTGVALTSAADPNYSGLHIVHATFGGIDLAAGTYWIGLSGGNGIQGPSTEMGIASFFGGDHSGQTHLVGDTADGLTGGGTTFAFRLEGTAVEEGDVPEPAAWAMMLGGFGLVGAALRSRRKSAVFFA